MEIRFRHAKDRRCYERLKEGTRRWGEKVARRYVQRINILAACESAVDVKTFPQLRFHPLKGERKGQYAVDIDEYLRLDEAMTIVVIEGVSKHYED